MERPMNCRFASFLIVLGWVGCMAALVARADTFELNDKSTVSGQLLAPDGRGILIKGDDGKISERIPWTNFTQTALKKIFELPAAKPFVELYLEPDEPEPSQRAAAAITLKPVPRLPRPDPRARLGAVFSSPLSVTLFLILYLANVYAAYEISVFRNYPIALVCGLAAIAPVLGPIVFLSLPTRPVPTALEVARKQAAHEEALVEAEEAASEPVAPPPSVSTTAPASAQAPAATSAPRLPPATIYQRGQTTFNRRFFETKLSGFLRIVPSEAEKDMVVQIRSARGLHAGQRITRVMPNELTLLVHKGPASSEVIIPYAEIQEVQIRHKDAA